MKKTLSAILACVIILGCVFSLVSCGNTLSGTYELAVVGGVSFEFSGKNVVLTIDGIFTDDTVIEGTYSIEEKDDGSLTITLDFDENKDASKYEGTLPFVKGTEGDADYIKIAGIKYVKK